MALVCRACGCDQVATGLDRNKCLGCGSFLDQSGQPAPDGLVWTSEVPAQTAKTAKRTKT